MLANINPQHLAGHPLRRPRMQTRRDISPILSPPNINLAPPLRQRPKHHNLVPHELIHAPPMLHLAHQIPHDPLHQPPGRIHRVAESARRRASRARAGSRWRSPATRRRYSRFASRPSSYSTSTPTSLAQRVGHARADAVGDRAPARGRGDDLGEHGLDVPALAHLGRRQAPPRAQRRDGEARAADAGAPRVPPAPFERGGDGGQAEARDRGEDHVRDVVEAGRPPDVGAAADGEGEGAPWWVVGVSGEEEVWQDGLQDEGDAARGADVDFRA